MRTDTRLNRLNSVQLNGVVDDAKRRDDNDIDSQNQPSTTLHPALSLSQKIKKFIRRKKSPLICRIMITECKMRVPTSM